VALELKKSNRDEADPLQSHKLSLIEKAGGVGITVSPQTWPMVYERLKRISLRRNDDHDQSGAA